MILIGCLLAFGIAVAPRLMLIFAWLFSDRWDVVWQGNWWLPLLGIIFLPFTTIMYLLTWTFNGSIEGWDWMWIGLGVVLDIWKWQQIAANRKEAQRQGQKYYPEGAPGYAMVGGAQAPVAVEQAPPSAPPAAPPTADSSVEPEPPSAPAETPKDDKPGG